jgi:aminoglycoside phosphotransferase (APT) family kinase protein
MGDGPGRSVAGGSEAGAPGAGRSGVGPVVRAPVRTDKKGRSRKELTLDESSVVRYLVGRGLLRDDGGAPAPAVTPLGGGVSSVVLLVEAGGTRVVVKQPRRRLLVKEEWLANPMRALTEARALTLVHQSTPEAVPPLLDVDAEAHTITMAAAPSAWQAWKERLLEGVAEPAVGQRLGFLLGTWHLTTSQHRDDLAELEDLEVFDQLRIDPYHRTVAARHPDLARQVASAAAALLASPSRRCLVHGDFSPKNVLLGEEGLWVIDFEVAHVGNPVFDLAFLTTHLVLKSLHRPAASDLYRGCASEFLGTYREVAGDGLVPSDESLGLQVGCLLLARVDGKSPAEYLTPEEQIAARELGTQLIIEPVGPLTAWPAAARPAPSGDPRLAASPAVRPAPTR